MAGIPAESTGTGHHAWPGFYFEVSPEKLPKNKRIINPIHAEGGASSELLLGFPIPFQQLRLPDVRRGWGSADLSPPFPAHHT